MSRDSNQPQQDETSENNPTRPQFVKFILTGFGPFGGVPDNPTLIIVNGMKDYLLEKQHAKAEAEETVGDVETDSSKAGTNNKSNLISHLQDCIVLETSAYAVQEVFNAGGGGGGRIHQHVLENNQKSNSSRNETQ